MEIAVKSTVLEIEPIDFNETCRLNVAIKLVSQILKFVKMGRIIICVFKIFQYNFLNFQTTEIYVKEHLPINMCTKFQVVISKKQLKFAVLNAKRATFYAIYEDFGIFLF